MGSVLLSRVYTAAGAWQDPDTDISRVFEADSCRHLPPLPPFSLLHVQQTLLSSFLCLQASSSGHFSKERKLLALHAWEQRSRMTHRAGETKHDLSHVSTW